MTQSSCKRDTKSKSHPSMKLAPVRVFSPPSHEIKRHTIEIHGGHEEGCCPGMGLSLNRPAPTNGIAVFRKKKYPASKHFNYGERSKKPGNTGASGEASRAEERDSFLSPPLAVASPLAWLLATPPNGELARRLEKVTKAMQIPRGGGWVAIMIYPVELWNPCDFRRFPTTFRKCRNVRRSVFRRRLSTSEATLGDSLVNEPKIHFRIKLLH